MEDYDHRRLGMELDLFHFQEEAAGQVFWHPKGWQILSSLKERLKLEMLRNGYLEVNTPTIMSSELWKQSGHLAKFDSAMLKTSNPDFIIKPMNCPGHVQIFNQGIKSYRDLPIRYFEFGQVFRDEPSLHESRSLTICDGEPSTP